MREATPSERSELDFYLSLDEDTLVMMIGRMVEKTEGQIERFQAMARQEE